ncbi:helix-turn-helix transcriptional regulator [Albibacillus kandeliae]|uniref:helix-turn-helix transcriptional regulator n=1 Tax=Albibacillus kandeliae TaxID=2174228 RepID=UPI000D6933B9|nr:helix-turn-helix transcriptional regulator [Albibacillus kandeliae]
MPIKPETLKKLRGDLSQEALAEKAGVSRKTISRIENGEADPEKIRLVTVERLAKALGTTAEKLAADPGEESVNEALLRSWGYRKINTFLHGDTALSLALVEQKYGISAKRQLDMAPLFAALLAEMSLRERGQKLEELSNAFEEYSASLPSHLQHGEVARSDFDNAYYDEKESIAARDLFGQIIQRSAEKHGYAVWPFDPDEGNPFVDFLWSMAKSLDLNIKDSLDDVPRILEDGLPEAACVLHEEVQEICGDNEWARLALQHGYARIRDIPKDLSAPEQLNERAAWLESKYPAGLRREREQQMAELFSQAPDLRLPSGGGKNA